MKTYLKAGAVVSIGLAAMAIFSSIQSPELHAHNGSRAVSTYRFPLFSAPGQMRARLNLECPSDPYAVEARMFFDVLQPVVTSPQFTDNPSGQCARYILVSRHDCEAEIKSGEAASYAIDLRNLQTSDYLIRAGIIIIGSKGPKPTLGASLELTQNNGASQVLGPYLGGPQPDPP